MKRLFVICLLVLLLVGCEKSDHSVNGVISLRNRVLQGKECRFTSNVTADYGESTYTFKLACIREQSGDMVLTVIDPESISGITAKISRETGKLIFDDKVVAFALVADDQLTPICCPWLFMESLLGGYIAATGKADEGTRIQIDDSFSGVQFSMDIWTGENQQPTRAELIWNGRRILSMDIDDFEIV